MNADCPDDMRGMLNAHPGRDAGRCAAGAAQVLRDSIAELVQRPTTASDPGHPVPLARQQDAGNVASWADGIGRSLLVVVEGEAIVAVGG